MKHFRKQEIKEAFTTSWANNGCQSEDMDTCFSQQTLGRLPARCDRCVWTSKWNHRHPVSYRNVNAVEMCFTPSSADSPWTLRSCKYPVSFQVWWRHFPETFLLSVSLIELWLTGHIDLSTSSITAASRCPGFCSYYLHDGYYHRDIVNLFWAGNRVGPLPYWGTETKKNIQCGVKVKGGKRVNPQII